MNHVKFRQSSFLRIGVHVRANDMLRPTRRDFGFTVHGTSYFSQAANYLIENLSAAVQFIVTSDSPDWTKKYIALETVFRNRSNTSVVYSEGGTTGFDTALLASCDALILSTGTYGWWAPWLGEDANKPTVYYRYWPRPGPPGGHACPPCLAAKIIFRRTGSDWETNPI